uniref:Uncharacterized protein n=1 Tax=Lactuca sativa TaxID=4236 RepID=A0A9R1WEH2_LACSA|nr:hypothetical protein LSAT_V11C200090610 [Lactuca sativa]
MFLIFVGSGGRASDSRGGSGGVGGGKGGEGVMFAPHGLTKIQVDASGDALLRDPNVDLLGGFDGPMCARSKAIIHGLLRSINKLKSQNTRLKCYLLCSWMLFVFVLVYKK